MRLNILLACFLLVSVAGAQQTNSSGVAELDVNGSTGSGSAPYSVTIEHPQPVVIQVTGAADAPYVLLGATGLNVGNTVFSGVGQIDIGPTPTVLVDGISGPFFPHFANTGPSGTGVIQVPVSQGSVATGSVVQGLQAAVVDPTSGPFDIALTAATAISFTNNVSVNGQPIADAGTSQFVDGTAFIALDGSASVDPEMSSLTYTWTQVMGTTVTLNDASTANPFFLTPSSAETLAFELVVNDGTQDSAPSIVYVPVNATVSTVSLASDLVPIFNANCSTCHTTTASGGLMMNNATNAWTGLNPVNGRTSVASPLTSLLGQKPRGMLGHGGGTIFASNTDPNYLMILTWMAQGANNN